MSATVAVGAATVRVGVLRGVVGRGVPNVAVGFGAVPAAVGVVATVGNGVLVAALVGVAGGGVAVMTMTVTAGVAAGLVGVAGAVQPTIDSVITSASTMKRTVLVFMDRIKPP